MFDHRRSSLSSGAWTWYWLSGGLDRDHRLSGAFRISRDDRDAAGVVHHQDQALIGESWSRGPLILSWDDVEQDMQGKQTGRNVVIHEIAHKLDMLNGPADGFPPLQHGMTVIEWSTSLSTAYEGLVRQVEHHHHACINPYAATSPAEFFAVISEYFFSMPVILHTHFADVYQQLQLYYRQNPLLRLHELNASVFSSSTSGVLNEHNQ